MIITGLKVENFRRFRSFQLDNLPTQGLLAVVGGNETGKSSLGDVILFGLFGRTESFPAEAAARLVHWGAAQATVSLRLHHRGHDYHLLRSINKAGQTTAVLFSTEEERTLADTPELVSHHLQALLGYGYGAFMRSFHWGQEHNHKPQGDMENLRNIAGLQEQTTLGAQLGEENRLRQEHIDVTDAKRELAAADLAALYVDDTHLPRLQQVGGQLEEQQQSLLQLGQRLDKVAADYPASRQRFQRASQAGQRTSFWTRWGLVIFILALLSGVFLLLAPIPNTTLGLDDQARTFWGNNAIRLAAAAALSTAVLLVYGWYVDMRHLRPLQQRSRQWMQTLQQGYDASTLPVSRWLVAESTDYLLDKHQDMPAHSVEHPDLEAVPGWIQGIGDYATRTEELVSAVEILNSGMNSRSQELGRYQQMLKADISDEQGRRTQRDRLQAALDEYDDVLEKERRDNVVYATAIELLQRDASHATQRFNALVKEHCPALLKRFTQGHYESLEIGPDFSFRVLSREKGDFLDFNEISAGTQRQLALAMQLALASALADATQADKHLLFLDEPFAFFDPERAFTTLQSLDDASKGKISQIWLTAQTRPQGVRLAQVIECLPDAMQLSA